MKYFIYCRKSTESEDRQILSLDSQQSEVDKLVAGVPDLEVVHIYRESQSAKKPGRPIFDLMLTRIERGDAQGIIAWNPDRLARNALDGARIIDSLDRGRLKNLKFCTFSFENSPQGKLMLFTLFGFSKYYVDSLSENIKRGNRTKAERGWRPSRPPIGYLHDPIAKAIVPDPERFDLVRQMFRLVLSGTHTPRSIHRMAKMEWGLRTLKRKSQGGALIHLSAVNKVLRNPFYAGVFIWEGRTMVGRHEPMLTLQDFDRIQTLFRRPGQRRPNKKAFAYTGLIRCGSCGLSITAETKRNKYGSVYTYYHCTRSRYETPCAERYVQAESLERQMVAFLDSLRIAPKAAKWLTATLGGQATIRSNERESQRTSIQSSVRALDKELDTLTDLRVRSLLTDEEFTRKRLELTRSRVNLGQQLEELSGERDASEPLRTLISFSNQAVELFNGADDSLKRLLLKTTSSNSTLRDRILNIQARKPFVQWGKEPTNTELRRLGVDVRTLVESNDKDFLDIIANIRTILSSSVARDVVAEMRQRRAKSGC